MRMRAAAAVASAIKRTVTAKIRVRRDGMVYLFTHADEGAPPAGICERVQEGGRACREINGIDEERPGHQARLDHAVEKEGAHAFEHICRCEGERNPLQPMGKRR